MRPYPFAVSLATAVVATVLFTHRTVGQLLDGLPGLIVASVAASSVFMLWVGWWFRDDGYMRFGLSQSTFVWGAVTGILALDIGMTSPDTLLAACWCVASGGSWLLERVDDRMRGGGV